MLSLGKIQLSGEKNCLSAVAIGIGIGIGIDIDIDIDDYYRSVGEAPGRWVGTASHSLDLDGEVEASDLHAIWAGENPATRGGSDGSRTARSHDLGLDLFG